MLISSTCLLQEVLDACDNVLSRLSGINSKGSESYLQVRYQGPFLRHDILDACCLLNYILLGVKGLASISMLAKASSKRLSGCQHVDRCTVL